MITLVLGGTRSGKSTIAEGIASSTDGVVTYLATAIVDPADADHVARVAAHRDRRPADWATVESRDLIADLRSIDGPVLVDSLGTWLTQHDDFEVDIDELVAALTGRAHPTIVVSEEVGLAVHPPTDLGRTYVDAMGRLNQAVAAVASRSILVVAGRTLDLGAPP